MTRKILVDQSGALLACIIENGRIEPGRLKMMLSPDTVADTFHLSVDRIRTEALDLSASFALRRSGAEARLILEDAMPEVDQILLRNLARGVVRFAEIKRGTTIKDVAERNWTTRQRVSATVDLAFLAPDLM